MSSREAGMGTVLAAMLATLSQAPAVQAQEQRGWLGIEVKCEECKLDSRGDTVLWWFNSPPVVGWVNEEGPAAEAGLQTGDVILAVDGFDILSEEGERRFGALQPGVPVRFRVRRDGGERTLTVTPGTQREAFGEYAYVVRGANWDSLRAHMKTLFEGQMKLRVALRQAERALQRTELQLQRSPNEEQRELAQQLRSQIDSISRELTESNKLLRLQADSLAARTLLRVPRVATQVEVSVSPRPEKRTITVTYNDAVAGARFEELSQDSPWLSYLPGVEEGLLIIKVVENTPAHMAGLREGDVVLAVNGEPVRTVADLRRALEASQEAELTYVRKGKKKTCKIPGR